MSDSREEGGVTVAYLGPKGTYGHQAASQLVSRLSLPPSTPIRHIPCPTIPDIYTHSAQYLVMPLQNTIHGGVLETIDSLLAPLTCTGARGKGKGKAGEGEGIPMIVDSLDLGIRHCLVARKGVKMEDIRWVRSHEQALGQSSTFLDTHLPRAKRIKWASTAGAAASLMPPSPSRSAPSAFEGGTESLPSVGTRGNGGENSGTADMVSDAQIDGSPDKGEEEEGPGAAICSKAAIEGRDELEVLYEGTQGIDDNYTRFLLLARQKSPAASSPAPSSHLPAPCSPPPPHSPSLSSPTSPHTHFFALPSPSLLSAFAPESDIVMIHSRPAPIAAPTAIPRPDTEAAAETKAEGEELTRASRYPVVVLVEIALQESTSEEQQQGLQAVRRRVESAGGQGKEGTGMYLGSAPAELLT